MIQINCDLYGFMVKKKPKNGADIVRQQKSPLCGEEDHVNKRSLTNVFG